MKVRKDFTGKILHSAAAVVEALGGKSAVAELTGDNANVVWNWVDRGRLPPRTYLVLTRALGRKKLRASPLLWSIDPGRSAPTEKPDLSCKAAAP